MVVHPRKRFALMHSIPEIRHDVLGVARLRLDGGVWFTGQALKRSKHQTVPSVECEGFGQFLGQSSRGPEVVF